MHRPFYSLAVLLEIIALSLVLVGSASSQSWEPWLNSVEKRAIANGESVKEEWSAIFRTVTRGLRNNSAASIVNSSPSLPWSPAAERAESSPGIVATGYDADYDFAMLGGSYQDIQISSVDIENSMASAEGHPGIEVFSISRPATSYYFDDWQCCVDAGFSSPVYVPSRCGGVSRGDVTWCGEAEGWVEASASSDEGSANGPIVLDAWPHLRTAFAAGSEPALTALQAAISPILAQQAEHWIELASAEKYQQAKADEARQTLRSLAAAGTEVVALTSATLSAGWSAISNLPLPELAGQESFEEYPVHHLESQPAAPCHDGEPCAMIEAAATLDALSVVLQQAAQELRYLAADRLVSNQEMNRR